MGARSTAAHDAIMVVIDRWSQHRRKVREAGCGLCKCAPAFHVTDICFETDTMHGYDAKPEHSHCKYCPKKFETSEHVYKHYCLKHPGSSRGSMLH